MFVDWNLDLTSFCRTVDYHLWTGLSIKSLQSHFYVRTFLQVERKMNAFWAIFVSAILWCSRICQNHRLWPWLVQPFWTWLWNWIGLKGPWEWRIWLRNWLRALWNGLEKRFRLDFGFYRAMMVTLNSKVLVVTMLGSWYLVNMQLSTNAMLFTTFSGTCSYFCN